MNPHGSSIRGDSQLYVALSAKNETEDCCEKYCFRYREFKFKYHQHRHQPDQHRLPGENAQNSSGIIRNTLLNDDRKDHADAYRTDTVKRFTHEPVLFEFFQKGSNQHRQGERRE